MSDCRSEQEINADLRALQSMMARGVLSMTYDGRSVTYRSMDDLQRAQLMLETELGEANGTGGRETRTYASVSKGY